MPQHDMEEDNQTNPKKIKKIALTTEGASLTHLNQNKTQNLMI